MGFSTTGAEISEGSGIRHEARYSRDGLLSIRRTWIFCVLWTIQQGNCSGYAYRKRICYHRNENFWERHTLLFDTASDIDRPIRYVIFMGGSWLIPSTHLQCVIYNDWLRLPSTRNIIGQVHLGFPIETDLDNGFIVWDASNPRFDVSADDPLCQVERVFRLSDMIPN